MSQQADQLEEVLVRLHEVSLALSEMAALEHELYRDALNLRQKNHVRKYYGFPVNENGSHEDSYQAWKRAHSKWLRHREELQALSQEFCRLSELHDCLAMLQFECDVCD